MAFSDELKKDNLKIIFVEITYLDNLLVQNTKYFSDYVVDLPEGLTDGGTLFPAIPRLKKIPFFARTVDYIDNDIVKGSYSIKIENTDNAYTSFFKDNYFKNASIKFYVTIDGLSTFDKLQLAEGTIKEIKINEKDIQLKIDEINLYQKNSTIETFDYTDQDPDLEGEFKPKLFGNIKDYKISDYNLNKAPVDEFKELSDVTYDASETVNFSNFIYFTNKDSIEKLRDNVKVGDFVAIPPSYNIFYEIVDLFPQDENDESFNLRIQVKQTVLSSGTSDGNVRIKINEDSSKNYDNKYYITKDTQTAREYEKTLLTANFSTSDNYIQINEDWNFLESGDVVFFARFSSVPLETFSNEYLIEEMVVDYYDEVNKRIYVKDYCPLAVTKFIADSWYVCFNKVNKIKIDDKQEYQKIRGLIEWDLNGVTGASFASSSDKTASVVVNSIKFTADTAGSAGNGTEYLFNFTGTSTVSISRSAVSNTYGSKYRWTIDFGRSNSPSDVVTALDAYDLANPGEIDFSYTVVGNERELKQSNIYEFENDFYQFPSILEGGYKTKSYLSFNYEDYDDATNGKTVKQALIYFDVDGDTTAPAPPNISVNNTLIPVAILSTDTASQIITKIQITVNALNAGSPFNPILCATNGDKIYFKLAKHISFPLDLTISSSSFPGRPVMLHSYVNFYTFDKSNFDLVLNFDKKSYNMAFAGYFNPDGTNFKSAKILETSFRKNFWGSPSIGFSGDFENLEKILVSERKIDDKFENATILFKNYIYSNFLYFTDVIEKDGEQVLYLNNQIFQSAYIGQFIVDLFENQEVSDVSIDYREKSHVHDILESMFSFYGITKYNATDLDTLLINHVDFQAGVILDDNKKLYEALKMVTESFNLYTYIDKVGDIRVKFYNPFDSTTPTEIDFNSVISINQDSDENKYSKYNLFINKKQESDSSTLKEITDPFLSSLAEDVSWEDIKELNSVIMRDFLSDSFDSYAYSKLFSAKYLSKVEEIEIVGSLKLLDFELGDLINISNYDKLDSSNSYIISNIETNGDNVKINAIRVIENPELLFGIIDENGNFVVDEVNNIIVGT